MNKLIKLRGVENNTDIFIYPKDVLLLQTSAWEQRTFYNVCVKGVMSWLSIDAESYFKLKAILEEKVN